MGIKRTLLKTFMKENNYTYKDLASIIECEEIYIKQIINGKDCLSYEMAVMLSSIFNITPDDIFYSECKENKEIKSKLNVIKTNRDNLLK